MSVYKYQILILITMSFNITLCGTNLYVTPWAIYSTGADSNSLLAFNEFSPEFRTSQVEGDIGGAGSADDADDTGGVDGSAGDGDAVVDGVAVDDDVVESNSTTVIKYVQQINIGGRTENDFTRVFPGYATLVGVIGLGLGARYGYRQRSSIVDTLRELFRRD